MPQLRIHPLAASDLMDIWSYIADDSEANADSFIDELYKKIQMLSRRPGAGRQREELAPGIHSFPCRRYVIFYRESATAIEIVRVLHGARDIQNLFENQPEGTESDR